MAQKTPRFRRHFEGYELGLLALGVALSFALLTLPRASEPATLPLPVIDRLELTRRDARAHEQVRRAEQEGLPFDVRAVGEALRRFGAASARGEDTAHDRDDIRARAQSVLATGQGVRLLSLRAVQTSYFLRALSDFERSAEPTAELRELGGDFPQVARKNGWLDGRGQLSLDASERRVLFELRWADLIGQRDRFPFAPTLEDWRVYYRFLLAHPEGSGASEADATRLRYVGALAKRDPEYPADLARGYLLYRLGDSRGAASAFRAHLAAHPSGHYSLLARNSLIYTLAGQAEE